MGKLVGNVQKGAMAERFEEYATSKLAPGLWDKRPLMRSYAWSCAQTYLFSRSSKCSSTEQP